MLKLKSSIRTRLLAIVLVPILALVGIGAAASIVLIDEGNEVSGYAEEQLSRRGINDFVGAIAMERQLSLLAVAGDQRAKAKLPQARMRTQQTTSGLLALRDQFAGTARQDAIEATYKRFQELFGRFEQIRGLVDSGRIPLMQIYQFYNGIMDGIVKFARRITHQSPSADLLLTEAAVMDFVIVADTLARGHALGQAAIQAGGLDPALYRAFASDIGSAREYLDQLRRELGPEASRLYEGLVSSKAWDQLLAVEKALIERGPAVPGNPTGQLPISAQEWAAASQQVNEGLGRTWGTEYLTGQNGGKAAGEDQTQTGVLGGVAVGALALLALVVALLLANRLLSRLRRLREQTASLAEHQVPSIMRRLKDGEQVDVNVALPPLEFGRDEIGQVADAFNRAQKSAVSAAMAEVETREGANAVFLNIAHRSQVVVHRQLEVLDRAEYKQEDPDQLELLFQLDHLATRERRNAENLIILGGEAPGRQWRNPVPLLEVVRSGVAETENYARVRTSRIPEVMLIGTAVADVIHLIAELVDNATSFSPPDSRVEIFGNQVGGGVVIEISDQGLGMTPEEFDAINAQLADPPEFGMMSLSQETRLGLFVVGRLAVRTGIKVRLVESEYGGVRAIVLVPSGLITEPPQTDGAYEADVFTGVPQPRSDRLERIDRKERAIRAWQEGEESSHPTQVVSSVEPPVPPRPRTRPDSGTMNEGNARWQGEESAVPSPQGEPTPQPMTQQPPTPQPWTRPEMPRPSAAFGNDAWTPTADRPPLPTRRKQEHLAPQLAEEMAPPPAAAGPDADDGPSPERSRDFMSAIQQGTTQARSAPAPGSGSEHFNMFTPSEKQDGNGLSWES